MEILAFSAVRQSECQATAVAVAVDGRRAVSTGLPRMNAFWGSVDMIRQTMAELPQIRAEVEAIASSIGDMLNRLRVDASETLDFCRDCQDAFNLESLSDMERRRDELSARFTRLTEQAAERREAELARTQ